MIYSKLISPCCILDIYRCLHRRGAESSRKRFHETAPDCPRFRFAQPRWMDAMTQSGIKPHEELDELLPFERLLAEISTFFINLPADQIGNQIVAAQKRICELLDLDRSALLLTDQDDPGMLLLTHVHQPPGSPPPPDRLNARDFYPWTVPKILSGETIVISKMTELPAEACRGPR